MGFTRVMDGDHHEAMVAPWSGFVSIRPSYGRYLRRSAPYRRNETVAELCTELHVIVGPWWAGLGGTAHTLKCAEELGRAVVLHRMGEG